VAVERKHKKMFASRLAILGALCAFPGLAQVSPALSQQITGAVARRQFGPIQDKVEHGGTATSTNWSGYAVLGGTFTSAIGSWIVPALDCSGVRGTQYAAFWVGLDGYSSDTVEQTGTESNCVGPIPVTGAWYEFYPQASVTIGSVPVKAGDVMSASVVYSGGEFTVTITNETTGKSYQTSASVPGAKRTSAEWITEAPCCTLLGGILPLPDFGTVNFGEDSTGVNGTNYATSSVAAGPIGNFAESKEINKVSSISSPQTSACARLSPDGTSFSCTWGH
jgi:hypothetical protein